MNDVADASSTNELEALRAALAAIPVGIAIYDAEAGLVRVNPRAADLLGLQASAQGAQLPVLSSEDRPDSPRILEVLRGTAAVHRLELTIQADSGPRTVFVDTLPLGARGSVSLLSEPHSNGVGTNSVVANLAHKLNNPLSTILMSAQLASGSAANKPERLSRLLTTIQENTRRCGKILEDAVQRSEAPSSSS